MTNPHLRNPHLDGQPFFWEGGPDGVLLVHGFTATTAEVRPLAHLLHSRGFTVAGPLLPGHADTPAAVNRYRWQDWYATVEDCYASLKRRCRRVLVGGESTGALLCLRLAALQPEVLGVLSYAAALRLQLSPLARLQIRLLAPFVTAAPKAAGTLNPQWQGYAVNPLKGVLQLLALQREIWPRLPQVRQPLLVVQGRLDPTVDPSVAQEIYDQAGSAIKELHMLEQSVHCVLIEADQEAVHALTLRFCERICAGEAHPSAQA